MIGRIDHLGIAVSSLAEGRRLWEELLGLPATSAEAVPEQGVRTLFLTVGESRVELLEPIGPDTPVGRFLARRGEGVHHVCFLVDDLEARLSQLEAEGVRLIDRHPRVGAGGSRVAFLHPSSTGGVLIELKESRGGEDR